MLINPATEEAVNLLVQRGFYHNRKFDRFLSYSNTIFAMSEYSKHFHSGLAHLYPLISDKFAEILERYNIPVKYYETPSDTTVYSSPMEFFQSNLEDHIKTYEMIKDAIDISTENGDLSVESDLKAMLRMWNKIMAQQILFVDKMKSFGENNVALFDSFSEQYYIIQDVYDELTGSGDDD